MKQVKNNKQTKKTMSRSERDWRDIFDMLTDMVTIHDRDFNIIYANKAAENKLGLPALNGFHVKCHTYYHGSDIPPDKCPSCECLTTEKPAAFEIFEPHLNMFIEIRAIPRFNSNNHLTGLIHIVRDITARKKAEQQHIKSEDRYRTFIDSTRDISILKDEELRYLIVNKACTTYFDKEQGEIIGKTDFELMPKSVAERCRQSDLDALKSEEIHITEEIIGNRIFETRKFRVRIENGRFGIGAYIRDITEFRQTQEELKERMQIAELSADVGRALTMGDTLRKMLQSCSEAMVKQLDVLFARVWTFDETENVLHLQASAGTYTHIDGLHSRIPLGRFKIGLIAQERKPHMTNNVIGDPRIHDQEWAKREKIAAFAGHPLVVSDKLVGVIALFSRKPFSEITLKALESVADEIAIGIENKQADETLKKHRENLEKLVEERTNELLESERKYRTMVENSNDLIWILDKDGNFTFFNKRAEEITGYKLDDWVGKSFAPLVEQGALSGLNKIFLETMEGNSLNYEVNVLKQDGAFVTLSVNTTPFYQSGKIIGTVSFGRDITENKKAENALRESEEKYRSLIETTDTGFVIIDHSGKVLDANPEYIRLSGYKSLDEILGRTILEWTAEYDRKRNIEIINKTGVKGFVRNVEIDYVDKKGKITPVEINGTAIETREGTRYIALCRDITERKHSRDRESALLRELKTLFENFPLGILYLDSEFNVISMNNFLATFTGFREEEIKGRPCYETLGEYSDDIAKRGREKICSFCKKHECFENKRPTVIERPFQDKFLRVTTVPELDGNGNISRFLEIVEDITGRKLAEAEAIRANHLASLGELAAGVAHEINNPINGIINYAQILSNETEKERKEHNIANRIIKESQRIATIVNSLLSFARDRKEQKNVVRIHKVIADALTLTETQMQKDGIRLMVKVPNNLPEIIAHPQHIEQVFLNVISNARYALNEKYQGAHSDKMLEILGEQITVDNTPYVRIIFYDRGTGIPFPILDKVLNPFFSTKPVNIGTGLGLSISHGIIHDHGGMIKLDSVEGEFTKASIYLPVKGKK